MDNKTDEVIWREARDYVTFEARDTAEHPTYIVSDGNASETAEGLDDAISIVEDWYDYMIDDCEQDDDRPRICAAVYWFAEGDGGSCNDIADMDALNARINEWEERIAIACGHEAWHGHGTYSVAARCEMGLNLTVTEEV